MGFFLFEHTKFYLETFVFHYNLIWFLLFLIVALTIFRGLCYETEIHLFDSNNIANVLFDNIFTNFVAE